MKKYSITSSVFTGEVVLGFNDTTGAFEMIDFSASQVSFKQKEYVLHHLPATAQNINSLKTSNSTITELVEVVTFELFWNSYDDKLSSSKKRTQTKWNKMTERDRCEAYRYLPKYFANIPSGTRKKYAETYLNSELWNN